MNTIRRQFLLFSTRATATLCRRARRRLFAFLRRRRTLTGVSWAVTGGPGSAGGERERCASSSLGTRLLRMTKIIEWMWLKWEMCVCISMGHEHKRTSSEESKRMATSSLSSSSCVSWLSLVGDNGAAYGRVTTVCALRGGCGCVALLDVWLVVYDGVWVWDESKRERERKYWKCFYHYVEQSNCNSNAELKYNVVGCYYLRNGLFFFQVPKNIQKIKKKWKFTFVF